MSANELYNVHLAQYVCELGCKSCDADPDQWMKPEVRSEVNKSIIHLHLYEIICIHHDPGDVFIKLNCYMPMKPSSFSRSDVFFGTILMHMQLHKVQ